MTADHTAVKHRLVSVLRRHFPQHPPSLIEMVVNDAILYNEDGMEEEELLALSSARLNARPSSAMERLDLAAAAAALYDRLRGELVEIGAAYDAALRDNVQSAETGGGRPYSPDDLLELRLRVHQAASRARDCGCDVGDLVDENVGLGRFLE